MTDMTNGTGSPDGDDVSGFAGFSPREAIGAVRRRWWIVLGVLVAIVGLALFRTLREARVYEASATVRIQPNRSAIAGVQSPYSSYDPRTDPLLSEQQVIKSQSVAERVADRLGLRLQISDNRRLTRVQLFGGVAPRVDSAARVAEYEVVLKPATYSFGSGGVIYGEVPYGTAVSGGGVTFTVPGRPEIDTDRVMLSVLPRASAAASVRGGIATKVVPQTNIVEIAYKGAEPVVVRDVANMVARLYAEYSAETQQATARGKSRVTQQARDSQAVSLQFAQNALRDFKERNQIGDVITERAALEVAIHQLESERQAADLEQVVYREMLGKLTQADTVDEDLRRLTGTDAVTKNSYIASLYTQWFTLEKEREELIAQRSLSLENADVQARNRLIARTKRDLQTASRQYLQGLQTRIRSLDSKILEQRGRLDRYPPLESEQSRLQANVLTAQTLFNTLQSQSQLSRIAESDDAGSVQLLDLATVPSFAISPNRRRAITYALAIGLLLGIGLALLLERLDDSVKSPDELRDRLGLPVLGLIPAINIAELSKAEEATPAVGRLATHADPRSPVAEAYRSLRTNLAFARANQALANQAISSLVVASPGPGDGKSTTAANLAITFAQQGQRVLLVDADMRRAVLDKTFNVPRTPGLTDCILGTINVADAASATQIPNLFVLPSGQFPPNPSELLGSPAMRAVLRDAKEAFDVVMFDSPPLLAVTDAAVLSTMVDGTILVVRTGVTAREAVKRALTQLRNVHARVFGGVLNDVNVRGGSYYGGYGHYYYAYYGSEANDTPPTGTGIVNRVKRLAGR